MREKKRKSHTAKRWVSIYESSLLAPISLISLLAHSPSWAQRPGQGTQRQRAWPHTRQYLHISPTARGCVHYEDTSKRTGKRWSPKLNGNSTIWLQQVVSQLCWAGKPDFRRSLLRTPSPPERRGQGKMGRSHGEKDRKETGLCENRPAVSNRTRPHPGKDANLMTLGSPSPPKPVTRFSQSWLFWPRGAFVASRRGFRPIATAAPATSTLPSLVREHWLAGWEGLQWPCLTLQGNHKQGISDILFSFQVPHYRGLNMCSMSVPGLALAVSPIPKMWGWRSWVPRCTGARSNSKSQRSAFWNSLCRPGETNSPVKTAKGEPL